MSPNPPSAPDPARPRHREPEPATPRAGALALLRAVIEDRRALTDLTAQPPAALTPLDGAGRARAQRLATETLRQMPRADAMMRGALGKSPPVAVHLVLRLALVEIFALGAPPHGVINEAVDLTRRAARAPKFAALVNAVLRKVATRPAQDWAALPPPRLPDWLRGTLLNAHGAGVVAAIEAAHLRPAPLDLSLRDPAQAAHWAQALGADLLPTGSLRLHEPGQITALPGYTDGAWWVQDAAAALPARLLAPHAGERVLDLCAAPGGKTLQLAAAGAEVTALDLSSARMARLAENLARTGLRANTVCADALDWRPEQPFDAVLLDAPCSATGTIRRHPDLPYLRAKADLPALTDLQTALLDRVLDPGTGILRPGGRVVFATCSLLPAEGEDQLARALAHHPGVSVVAPHDKAWSDWLTPDGGIRTRPDHWADAGGMDGFFMVALQTAGVAG